MERLYATCCQKIASKCSELEYEAGYRFLLCSKDLFNKETKILFLGLNPGVDKNDVTKVYSHESCEHGCAFFSEEWDGNPRGTQHLQVQVRSMLSELKSELGVQKSTETFANEDVLSAYFIPFRSSRLADLPKAKLAIQFSKELWKEIFVNWNPQIILSLGGDAAKEVTDILLAQGFVLKNREVIPSGWGKQTLEVITFSKGDVVITLGKLLHLSQFKIFSRDACREPIRNFMRELCANYK